MISVKLAVTSLIMGLGIIAVAQQSAVLQQENYSIRSVQATSKPYNKVGTPKALSQSEYFYNRDILLRRLKNR